MTAPHVRRKNLACSGTSRVGFVVLAGKRRRPPALRAEALPRAGKRGPERTAREPTRSVGLEQTERAGSVGKLKGPHANEVKEVSLNFTSWNRIRERLGRLEQLRRWPERTYVRPATRARQRLGRGQSIAGFDVTTNSGLRVHGGNRYHYRRDGAAPSFQSHTLGAPRGSSSHKSPVGACHP